MEHVRTALGDVVKFMLGDDAVINVLDVPVVNGPDAVPKMALHGGLDMIETINYLAITALGQAVRRPKMAVVFGVVRKVAHGYLSDVPVSCRFDP